MLVIISQTILLGIIEGLTEFLPISSTGHLLLANSLFSFTGSFALLFTIVIQLGALLAVIVSFWKRLWPLQPNKTLDPVVITLWKRTIIGVIPALIIGALLGEIIEKELFKPSIIALSLIIGGIIILLVEKRNASHITEQTSSTESISFLTAFKIGCIQCLAIIPGVSRSGATIIGARLLGLSRQTAVEFSFFLALPTLVAASGYSLLKYTGGWTLHEVLLLLLGFAVSALTAFGVIRFLLTYIQRHTLSLFGWYRIILGIMVLVFLL